MKIAIFLPEKHDQTTASGFIRLVAVLVAAVFL